jgi:hypothetical protein
LHLVAKAVLHNKLLHKVSAHARLTWGWEMADIGAYAALMISPLTQLEGVAVAAEAAGTVNLIETVEGIHAGWALISRGSCITRSAFAEIHVKGTPVKPGASVAIHREGPLKQVTTVSGIAGALGADTVWVGVTDEVCHRALAFKTEPHAEWALDDEGALSETGQRCLWVPTTDD